uniref:KOW domain-containing protein n=1 Tax=Phaeomonas parva TaxID=124430 RepID=A0A7S1XNW4_9STRA
MENEVARQFLLPTPQDSKLFMVGVKRGHEKLIVTKIMSKAIAEAREGNDIGIESAMTTGSKEIIFVEGRSEPKVKAALGGINNVYMRKIKLVPLGQMTEVLNVARRAKKPLREGQWVRLKRGVYKGDLAKVLEMVDGGSKALVQLVPRLDLTLMGLNAIERRSKSTGRPPQRLFSAAEVQKLPGGRNYLSRRDMEGVRFYDGQKFDFFENNYFDANGFLLKVVGVATQVDDEEIEPRIEELMMFKGESEKGQAFEEDGKLSGAFGESSALSRLAMAAGNLKTESGAAATFSRGDRVQAVSGDLANLVGTVARVDPISQLVYVSADNKDVTMDVAFQAEQLAKLIVSGDHVKVIGGRYTGETGTVVSVDVLEGERVALIVSDLSYGRQMAVSIAQLKVTPEVAQGLNRLQGYEVNDLVALGHNEVGIIIQVLREQVVVLDTTNDVREFRPEELRGKMNHMSTKRPGLGADRVSLRPGDQIYVEKGPEKRRSGTILHIYRNKLFIHDKHRTQNNGVFTAKAAECRLYGQNAASRQKASINDILSMQSRRMPSKNQEWRGKSVKIRKGKLKGFLGVVVEENDNTVKVELHARHQKVTMDKKFVRLVSEKRGDRERSAGSHVPSTPLPDALGATPGLGVTPAILGGQTPALGMGMGVTPMADTGSTPGYWQVTRSEQLDLPGSTTSSTPGPYGESDDGWHTSNSSGGSTPLTGGHTPVSSEAGSTPSLHTPTSEYSVDGDAASAAEWAVAGIMARNLNTGFEGRIMAVDGDNVTLAYDEGTSNDVPLSQVEKVVPKLGDQVQVIAGRNKDLKGQLVEIDEKNFGCLKLPNVDGMYKLVEMKFLAKLP